MSRSMQRVRGAVGTALIWAVGWCVTGVAVALTGVLGVAGLSELAISAVVFAALGFIGGATFSLALTLVEGRKRFDQLSIPRMAVWGAVGGVVVQAIMAGTGMVSSVASFVFVTLMASGSAAGTLGLARLAGDRSLSGGEEVEDIGLSKAEIDKLLGP